MKWFSNRRRIRSPEEVPTDLLRRYIEGEISPRERDEIRAGLRDSEIWRREFERMDSLITTLRSLPTCSPPERVWQRIAQAIEDCQPVPVWFPWMYRYPGWIKAVGIGCGIALIGLFGLQHPYWGPSYQLVDVQDSAGFGSEAETYLAHHDLSGAPPLTRESLIAFYTLRTTGSNE